MIKKIIAAIFIVLMLAISGASDSDIILQHFVFFGENDSWSAEYKTNYMGCFSEGPNGLHYDSYGNAVLTVTYKKELSDLSSVKHFEFSYLGGSISGWLTEDYDTGDLMQKTYTFRDNNGRMIQEDATPIVTINLDGKIETIELKNHAVN